MRIALMVFEDKNRNDIRKYMIESNEQPNQKRLKTVDTTEGNDYKKMKQICSMKNSCYGTNSMSDY